ncbi:MAG: ATP-binding cassette domain-containing protein [Lachnospiraceae bacterium]|nr:ATP-binding cassette domain-containing protein [Lachnospiraceae bacterium]
MGFEAKRINKAFGVGGARRRVVRSFSMKVNDGEMVAIVGKKGSGKSTLMNILSGLLRPDSGTITIDGHRIYFWNPFQTAMIRSKRVGVVPRDSLLINDMTIYENLLVPMGHRFMTGKRKLRRAKEVLRAVGLKGFGKYYPADLEDFEIQKVCLARAIMTKPKYLILDEPTGNLQSADVDRFMDIVEILHNSGFTVIVLTHSRRVASHCERLIPITQPKTLQPEPEEEDEDEDEDDEDEDETEESEEEEESEEGDESEDDDEDVKLAGKYERGDEEEYE